MATTIHEKADRLFGKVAVKLGVISEAQMREALELQRFMKDPIPLGAILQKMGLLKDGDLERIISAQSKGNGESGDRAKSLHEDNLFGKVAVSLGYLSEDELEECVNLQVSQFKSKFIRLGDIMIQRGFLSPRQVAHILQHQRGLELFCPACDHPYNVVMFNPGTTLLCYRCGANMRIPVSVYKAGFTDLVS